MTIKGDLTHFKLADIFQMLGQSPQEGTLVVQDGENKKWLHFAKGGVNLLFSGRRKSSLLGDLLVSKGKITSDQLKQALELWRRTGQKVGEILQEEGLVTAEDIEEAVREQIVDEVVDLFDWPSAQFEFIPGPPPEEFTRREKEIHRVAIDIDGVLLEAAKRADEWSKLESIIGSVNEIYMTTRGGRSKVEPPEREVYKAVDGSRTVHDIIALLGIQKLEAGQIIASLREKELIRPAMLEELLSMVKREKGHAPAPRICVLYELALKRQEDVELRARLAEAYEAADNKAEAVRQLKRVAGLYEEQYRLPETVDALLRTLKLDPEDLEAREHLVELYVRLANVPHSVLHLKRLSRSYAERRQYGRAVEALRRAVNVAPEDFETRKQLASLLITGGHTDAAFEEVSQLEDYATTPHQRSEVAHLYGQILALKPDSPEIRERLVALTQAERKTMKKRTFSKRVALYSLLAIAVIAGVAVQRYASKRRYEALRTRVAALVEDGKTIEAIKELRRYDSQEARKEIERLLAERKRWEEEEARRHREMRARAAIEENYGNLKGAASLYLRLADEVEDESYLDTLDLRQKAERLIVQWNQAERLYNRGKSLLESGDCRGSHEVLRELTQQYPKVSKALKVKLPVRVVTIPPGAYVMVDDFRTGRTPTVVYMQPDAPMNLFIEKPGHKSVQRLITDADTWEVSAILLRKEKWRFQTGGAIEANPFLGDGTVYVGSRDGFLYALDAEGGTVRWQFEAGHDILSSPSIGAGLIFFGTNDGSIFALDMQRGTQRWVKRTRGFIRSCPAVVETDQGWMVIVGAADKRVYAIGAEEGETLWEFETGLAVEASPRVEAQQLYVASDDGTLYALDVLTGKLIWKLETGQAIYSSPAVAGGMAYVANAGGDLFGVNAEDGQVVWRFQCEGSILSSLCVGKEKVFAASENGSIYAVDAAKGKLVWEYKMEGGVTASPQLRDGVLYVGGLAGTVCAMTAQDGALLWIAEVDGPVRALSQVSESGVFLGTDDGSVCAFEP